MPTQPTHIAMWSGPRNISTAMLRSWGNRADTAVYDEPLYAHFLRATGMDHPGAEEIIAAGETDWRKVVAEITGPIPGGKTIWYQKHMTHHLLPDMGMEMGWIDRLTNCFLIREPRAMLTSYIKVRPDFTMEDLGLPQQRLIFDYVRATTGRIPPVIAAEDVLRDPRRTLGLLCAALELPFDDAMLSWPPGPRSTDGVWAKYWYASVERSTSFIPYSPKDDPVPPRYAAMMDECDQLYAEMAAHKLS